ncbi:MAG TPA: methyltransferase domain-containing protein [bacterium]|nr:methyltransferase domain-containing protein [bacterium]
MESVEVRDAPTAWPNVDQAVDPARLVRYLDAVGAIVEAQQYKRQTFAALEIEPGHRVLDVGCGTGEDVRMLAQFVGLAGRAVGVDSSNVMITEATRRALGTDLPVEFRAASVYCLPFPDAAFDGCRADRMFQHLDDPRTALCEMSRVVRSGGRIVVSEPDWDTLIVDADRDATRMILHARCDRYRSGRIGRQLAGLFRKCGLLDVVTMPPTTFVVTSYDRANDIFGLRDAADRARDAGVVSAAQAGDWLGQLEEADRTGCFFSAGTLFTVVGRRA